MHPIWFQLTGSHHPNHPESILYKDGRTFIGGQHSMGDYRLPMFMHQYKKGIRVEWLSLHHTKSEIMRPPCGEYPKYSWFYDNKMLSADVLSSIKKILDFDKEAFIIFFSCFPLRHVLESLKLMKLHIPREKYISIYYKRFFDESQISLPGERVIRPEQAGPSIEHFSSREIENEIIPLVDIHYLSESENINGKPSDGQYNIDKLKDIKNGYLFDNKQFKTMLVDNKVYEMYDYIANTLK